MRAGSLSLTHGKITERRSSDGGNRARRPLGRVDGAGQGVGPTCSFKQTCRRIRRMLERMELQRIKMTVSALWVLTAVVIATVADLSWSEALALASFGLLPPLAMLLLWNDPAQTISQSIQEARR